MNDNKAKKWPTQERKMWENKAKQMNYEGKRINKSIKKHKAFMETPTLKQKVEQCKKTIIVRL